MIVDDEEQHPQEQALTIFDIIQAQNIVPMMGDGAVNLIGSQALDEYQIDERSREDWLKRYDRAMKLAMQMRDEKTFPWPNASNVGYPLLTQAAIQFQARAYPAIIDGANIVKGVVKGRDEDGQKAARAERMGQHMTWQLLYDIPGWEEDTDKLLLRLPIIGCVFRKSWHDPVQNRCMSETVPAKDFCVNYMSPGLDKAPRFTHIQRYYPHEIEEFIRSGLWERVHYEGDDGDDPMSLVEVYEQHRLIDIDGDGYPEPYVVTFTKDGSVFRIVACFDQDGISVAETEDGQQIVRIERKKYFTKYGFIPAPDGSFYDIGFGTLLDNISASIDTILNQLIDAGTLSNMQGGFLAGGIKIKGGSMRFTPGEWKRIDGPTGGPLRDSIVPLQLPGPSPVLFQLLGMLIDAAKDITSVQDILTGSQDSQTAPTTALALIEQGQKVFTGIYKRIHRAFGEELRIIRMLNRDYLDDQVYANLNDTPIEIGRADYQDKDLDVVPISDPTAVNDMQKLGKAQVLMAHNGDPLINQLEIRKRSFEAAGIPDLAKLFEVPQPGPDPVMLMELKKQANEREKTEADIRMKDAAAANSLMSAAKVALEMSLPNDAAAFIASARNLATEVTEDLNEPAGERGRIPEMGGPSGDESLPPVPEGPGVDALQGMGIGEPEGGMFPEGGPMPGGNPAGPVGPEF